MSGGLIEPEHVVVVTDLRAGMRGFLVIDNTRLGPGKGGIRMTPDVSVEEVARLARVMTWKNALANLPFGGAKAGIIWNGGTLNEKRRRVTAFARALQMFMPKYYIAGPDVASGEREMAWLVDAVKNPRAATGKPRRLGGLPHELGSTGLGVAWSARTAFEHCGGQIADATVAIEGFGNVGTFAAHFLYQWGARVVAVADRGGMVFNENGLEIDKLIAWKKRHGSVAKFSGGENKAAAAIFHLPVSVLIPASVTDVITNENETGIKTKLIVEGANIPMREQIEKKLARRGVLVVPDFVANAGGVISSYAEHRGWSTEKMFKLVERKIRASTAAVLTAAAKNRTRDLRTVALQLAQKKVLD